MIKFPVRVREVDTTYESAMGGWNVLSRDGSVICTQSEKSDADTIANALNAVHEFPRPLHEKPEKSTFADRLYDWYDKYINPVPKE
jgi:hypothetical protein